MADPTPTHGRVAPIAAGGRLSEVWGDVVDLRHLRIAIAIGATVSLGVYGVAVQMLTRYGDGSQVDRAYAMLFGLAGCLLACAICSFLLPPKRMLQEAGDPLRDRGAAAADLLERSGGRNHRVPPATVAEMIDLGLDGLVPEDAERALSSPTTGALGR